MTPFLPDTIVHYDVTPNINTLILGKLIICLIRMQQLNAIDSLIDALLKRAIHDASEEAVFLEIGRSFHALTLYNFGAAYMTKLLALDAFARNAEALLIMGTIEQSRGSADAAMSAYKRVLELAPNSVPARINSSAILQARGDADAALQVLMNVDLDLCSQLPVSW